MFGKDCKFELNEEQYMKVKEWDDTHPCTLKPQHGMRKYCGAIGGALAVTFRPTSLGTIVEIQCVCGETLDVSEDF